MNAAIVSLTSELLVPISILAGAAVVGVVVSLVVVRVVRGIARRSGFPAAAHVTERLGLPAAMLVPAIALAIAVPLSGLPEASREVIQQVDTVLIMVAIGLLFIRMFALGEDFLLARYPVNVEDNLKARKVHTQIRYLRRIASFVIIVIVLGAVLLTFEEIQQVGATLLTTAGVAGVIVGFAAQKTLATIIAGLQIAFTQPIRLDDAVIVEGEWGRIEEITLTYVVVKLWDWRRLVVPINYFIDNVFQNWTRSSSRMIGTVYLYVDYHFPVPALREELSRVLEATDLWDGAVQVVQVTGTTEKSVELRVLVSSTSSPRLWDLRCLVRERLISFVQSEYPQMLPRFRAELEGRPE